MHLSDYLTLWRFSKQRLISEEHYSGFQSFQAKLLMEFLTQHGIKLSGQLILDLGCGIGGYSQEFVRASARVIALDLMQPRPWRIQGLSQVRANAGNLPLPDEMVDLVFCASLIEHISQPKTVISEIYRVLKVGGACYISFPPYYSPVGGHEFSPFHYLGEQFALRHVRRHQKVPLWVYQLYNAPNAPLSFAELYNGWGLYKMTIRRFQQLVKSTGLVCMNASTRYMPVSFIRWPLFGEILTWHAHFILLKER